MARNTLAQIPRPAKSASCHPSVRAPLAEAWLPGFIVDHAGGPRFIDDCLRGVIRAFAAAYPDLFKGIDLTAADQSRDRF